MWDYAKRWKWGGGRQWKSCGVVLSPPVSANLWWGFGCHCWSRSLSPFMSKVPEDTKGGACGHEWVDEKTELRPFQVWETWFPSNIQPRWRDLWYDQRRRRIFTLLCCPYIHPHTVSQRGKSHFSLSFHCHFPPPSGYMLTLFVCCLFFFF